MMLPITPQLLQDAVLGCTEARATRFALPVEEALGAYGLTNPEVIWNFLAQVGHECGAFTYMKELWGPTPAQRRYERDFADPWPSSAAEARTPTFATNRKAYELGNDQLGDGRRYCGRGGIQTTGRTNYAILTTRLRKKFGLTVPDFVAEPERLEEPRWAMLSSADYWDRTGCSALVADLEALTRRINGGLNGLDDRRRRTERSKVAILAATEASPTLPADDAPEEFIQRLEPTPTETVVGYDPVTYEPIKEKTMIPALGFLASTLIEVFKPVVQEKITKEMARHGADSQVAAQMTDALVGAAQQVTKLADPLQAVAAVRADPKLATVVEESALDFLTKMSPLIKQIEEMELRARVADEASMDAAAKRNPNTTYDLTKPLIRVMVGMLGAVFVILFSVMVTQMWKNGDGTVAPEVWAQFAGLIGFVSGVATTVFAFRFGTSQSSNVKDVAKDALINELTKR